MTYAILTMMFIATFHLLYESVIAPAVRTEVRHKLFALRDQLRSLKIELGKEFSDRHFYYLQDSMNGLISLVDVFDLVLIARVRRLKQDSAFRARCEARIEMLDDCRLPQVKELRDRSTELGMDLLIINSGGWVIYVIPIIPIALLFGCYAKLKHLTRALASISEPDLKRLAPGRTATAPI
jgi:hypothetical protein